MENRLKEWRDFRGLTQTELAEEAGTSYQTIQRLERGKPPRPGTKDKAGMSLTTQWMERLAPALGIRPYQLVKGSEVALVLSHQEWKLLDRFQKLDDPGRLYVMDAISDALAAKIEKKTPQEIAERLRRNLGGDNQPPKPPHGPPKTRKKESEPDKVL